MNNLNKITHTKVGDNIHYYINGQEGRGVVVKMNNAYVSVLKETGSIDEIHINDTFFVKDIVANKTWNDMTLEERTENLYKAHAYSPRFLSKTWEELPQELKDVLQKTNIEDSTHGQIGGNRAGVSTDTDVETPEDYKGESKDDKKEEFKHEHQEKPTVDKNNGMEQDHKKKEQSDGMTEDWRPTGGESDKQKNYINKVKQGNKFVNNPSVGSGISASQMADTYGGSKTKPAKPTKDTKYFDDKGNPITREEHEAYANKGEVRPDDLWKAWLAQKEGDGAGNSGVNSLETTGVYNARYSDDKGRYRDQEKDKDEKDKEEKKE